ncbi:MAG TPA: ABC transporter permease [Gaiellales bacterium]|jgi:ABC-2 type transport system permease protein|nr:ABC transporter permease [Gaiellales bacterium]
MSTPAVRTAELRTIRYRGAWALAAREMRRVLGLWTQTILPSIVTAVLFLAVFGGALGGALHNVAGVPYVRFILPGLLVMTVVVQAFANSSTSLFQAKNEGYIEDLLTSPLRPSDIALAYPTGGLVRGWLAALAITLVAAPFAGPPRHPAVLAAALVLSGVVFSTLGLITGIWADTFDQHAFIANLVITPLALGGVFYPADRLSEPWSTLTRLDPLYYLVDAARYGAAGIHESDVALSLFVAALLAGLTFVAARAVLASGWRLRP